MTGSKICSKTPSKSCNIQAVWGWVLKTCKQLSLIEIVTFRWSVTNFTWYFIVESVVIDIWQMISLCFPLISSAQTECKTEIRSGVEVNHHFLPVAEKVSLRLTYKWRSRKYHNSWIIRIAYFSSSRGSRSRTKHFHQSFVLSYYWYTRTRNWQLSFPLELICSSSYHPPTPPPQIFEL